jgi:hypothetical protein
LVRTWELLVVCFQLTVIGHAHEPLEISGNEILTFRVQKKWLDKRLFVYLSEDGSCACSLLSEGADWNEPVWKLRGEILPRLAATLGSLHGKFEGGFTFEALWLGDQIKQQAKVSIDELVGIINENRIANFNCYSVQ